MEIKANTLVDKIYDNWMTILFIVVVISAVVVLSSIKIGEQNKIEADRVAKKAHEVMKIKIIKKDKPHIICKGVLFQPTEYDLSSLNNQYYIVTNETVDKPINSSLIKDCEVYTNETKTMVIKPKIVIPIDVQHENQVKELQDDLYHSEETVKHLSTKNTIYKETLDKANNNVIQLKSFIADQDKELDRLILIEAQFNQIDGLLAIVLKKKNLKVADLVIKPIKPKPKVVKVTRKIKTMKPLSVKVKQPTAVVIANNTDRLQRILYTIRFLTQRLGATQDKLVPAPSEAELTSFSISQSQVDNFVNVGKQLMTVVERLTLVQTRNHDILDNRLRTSIRVNVGI